jgi:hypothetical protein
MKRERIDRDGRRGIPRERLRLKRSDDRKKRTYCDCDYLNGTARQSIFGGGASQERRSIVFCVLVYEITH